MPSVYTLFTLLPFLYIKWKLIENLSVNLIYPSPFDVIYYCFVHSIEKSIEFKAVEHDSSNVNKVD